MKFSTQSYLTSSPGFPLSWFWKLKRCCETKKSWAGKTLNKAFNEALEHLKDFENPFCSPLFGPKLLIKFDPHSQQTKMERFHSGFHHFVNQPMPRLPMAVTQLSSASALLAHMQVFFYVDPSFYIGHIPLFCQIEVVISLLICLLSLFPCSWSPP